ncbi:thiamine phosphate synthase [Brevundimonas sp. S30B]|nr:thiamine phosphate synthase [Brevundimonas sp. MF30-B]TFW04476.1 thiamine phosphate synthase [Brevundimonas sp. S30B]
MRSRASARASAMDEAGVAGDEADMTALLTDDAQRLWDAAQALNRAAAAVSPAAGRLPPLLFFTDPARTPRPWETAARLPAGAGVVFRHFGAADALDQARRLRQATRSAGVRLLIGLDAELAQAVAADGVHLPERALSTAYGLSERYPGWIMTGAAHSKEALNTVRALDAVVLSPVFPAGGASASRPSLGLGGLAELAAAAPCRAYALGGVTAANAATLTGVCGLAAVDSIAKAFGPDTIRT